MTFLPGAAGAGEFWTPVIRSLRRPCDVRVIDLPGLGRIPADPDVHGYRDLVDFVAGRTTDPGAVIAQSMGAFIGLDLALRKPDLVTHLVLVAATGGVDVAACGAADWRGAYMTEYPESQPWATEAVPDLTPRLGEMRAPVLLIWPSADPLSPIGVARAIAAKVSNTSLVTFESNDHWVARRFPMETAAAIESFVGRQPPPRRACT